MDNVESSSLKKIIDYAYRIYHFAAKVFLYSILIILILVGIGFFAYFVDVANNIKNGVTKKPLLGAYIIVSPSMVPTIKVEDAIIIKRQDPKTLEVGDIITFSSSDSRYAGLTITHRIVGIEKSDKGELLFRTKGDNNNSEDSSLVSSENIFGRVILKIPKIGYIQYVLTQTYGWLLFVVIPCLGVVIYDIIKLIMAIINSVKSSEKKKIEKTKNKHLENKIDYVDVIGEEENNDNKEDKLVKDNSEEILGESNKLDNLKQDDNNDDDDIEIL